jgi:putative ABC transport system permease protein
MMMKALSLACVALIGIMMLLVGNTIAIGVRERTREYATLRAIGFTPWHVAGSIVAEAMLLGGLGGLLGLGVSYPLVDRALGGWIVRNLDALLPYFRVATSTAALALAASGPASRWSRT